MSHLDYYRQDLLRDLPHSGGLRGWGLTMIIIGSLIGGIAVLSGGLFFLFVSRGMAGAVPFPGIVIMTFAIYLLVAGGLIWLGIGSRQGRRWVRPIIVCASVITAVQGLVSIVPLVSAFKSISAASSSATTRAGTPAAQPGAMLIGYASGGCFVLLFMEVIPLILVWFYGRASVKATLETLDPTPRWTDRCPLPVFCWAMICLLIGFGSLFIAVKAVFPFFTVVLTGAPAVAVSLTLTAMLLVGGYLSYRLNFIGWLLSFCACVAITSDYFVFGLVGDRQTYIDQLLGSMPANSRRMADDMATNFWIGPALSYGVASVYALWLVYRFNFSGTSAGAIESVTSVSQVPPAPPIPVQNPTQDFDAS